MSFSLVWSGLVGGRIKDSIALLDGNAIRGLV